MGLAHVIWTIAEQRLLRLLHNAAAEYFTGDLGNVHIGNASVVAVCIQRWVHARASGSRKERNVLRRSTWRFAAQLSIPHRSPRMTTLSFARVTAVYSKLR